MPKVIKRGDLPSHPSSPPSPLPTRRAAPPIGRPRKPIIEKEVVEADHEARRIVAEAERQASAILEEAEAQAAQLRQQGYDEGYQEGLGQHTEQTTRALLEVERLKGAIEPEYVRLVTACVRRIVGEELKQHPESIVNIVRAALRDATQQREINVRVHPADAEALRRNQRRLLDVLARAGTIEIREDDSVSRGGCIVITELGTIDASLDRQIAAIEAALEEELVQGEG